MPKDVIVLRNMVMQRIRAFFFKRDYLEVETPIRLKNPCMELHIDAEPCGDWFLRTSPEIFHKKLLASGCERIFEIAKCFRCDELGPLHHPEYTMLEWYCGNANYKDVLADTKELLQAVWPERLLGWREISVSEAFSLFAGWDPVYDYDEDRFDIDLVEKVEPALKEIGGAVVLLDYPLKAAALSQQSEDNPLVAERWELYIDGVELANAYSELTDPDEQRLRFEACAKQREALGKVVYAIDEEFIEALGKMSPTGGVALGIDRLLMLMLNANSLDAVLPFR